MKVVRKHISKTRRVALFERERGVCYLCQGMISPGEAWEVEHVIALAAGGEDDESNWKLAHKKCHTAKTKEDHKVISKVKRIYAKHIGAKPEAKKKIQSRGFTKKDKREKIAVPRRTEMFGIKIGDDDE